MTRRYGDRFSDFLLPEAGYHKAREWPAGEWDVTKAKLWVVSMLLILTVLGIGFFVGMLADGVTPWAALVVSLAILVMPISWAMGLVINYIRHQGDQR